MSSPKTVRDRWRTIPPRPEGVQYTPALEPYVLHMERSEHAVLTSLAGSHRGRWSFRSSWRWFIWNCGTCAISWPSSLSAISRVRRKCWGSPSRPESTDPAAGRGSWCCAVYPDCARSDPHRGWRSVPAARRGGPSRGRSRAHGRTPDPARRSRDHSGRLHQRGVIEPARVRSNQRVSEHISGRGTPADRPADGVSPCPAVAGPD